MRIPMNTIVLRILGSAIATVLIGCAPQSQQISGQQPAGQPPQPMTGPQQSTSDQPPADQQTVAQPQQLSPGPPAVQPPQTTTTAQQTPLVSNQPPADEVTPDPWPKTIKEGNATFTLYQPQLDSWDGYSFEAHAACSVLVAGNKDPDFGVIEIT